MSSSQRGDTGESRWLPLLATGSLGVDYEILRRYFEVARELGRDPSSVLLTSDDLNYLRVSVNTSSSRDLDTIISLLVNRFIDRIDPLVASETYRRFLGVEHIDQDTAVRMFARVLAVWCIEAGETLGYVRIHGWGGGRG